MCARRIGVSELMARFLNEAIAKSAAHLHSQMLAPVQPAQESSPTPHEAPTQPVTSSKRGQGHPVVYHDHSLANQVQMALTAQVRGPCWVARNSVLWGYDEPLAKQTISTWQKQLPRLLAKASGHGYIPRRILAPSARRQRMAYCTLWPSARWTGRKPQQRPSVRCLPRKGSPPVPVLCARSSTTTTRACIQ